MEPAIRNDIEMSEEIKAATDTKAMLELLVENVVGIRGVEMVGEDGGWAPFSPFDEIVCKFHEEAMEALSGGHMSTKELAEMYKRFDFHARSFLNSVPITIKADGKSVTFAALFGDVKTVSPEYVPYLLGKLLIVLIAEKKVNDILRARLGEREKIKGIEYSSVKGG